MKVKNREKKVKSKGVSGFRPVQKRRIYQEIIEQIQSMIERGELKPGHKLPSERELAEICRVSRPAVREALSALEIMKVIEIRPGEGTFIRNTRKVCLQKSLSFLKNQTSPFEVLQARKVVESGIAKIAACEAKEEDLVLMEKLVEKMKKVIDEHEKLLDLDYKLHVAIAEATHNPILREIGEYLAKTMKQELWHILCEKNLKIPGRAERYVAEHQSIHQAIKEKDQDKAYRLMIEHIEGVARDLFE
ncbi:FadR family transcriptional regulator [Candidatus Aerophobetes bacterium]|nr:FadR family transcriptional regulator [Candidatus Aerophobetes bacterium]